MTVADRVPEMFWEPFVEATRAPVFTLRVSGDIYNSLDWYRVPMCRFDVAVSNRHIYVYQDWKVGSTRNLPICTAAVPKSCDKADRAAFSLYKHDDGHYHLKVSAL